MLALQYSWEELDDFIIKRPWHNVWKFNVLNIFDYYKNRGIYGIEVLQDTFGPLLKGKDLELAVTLKEFYEATGKTIYLYAVKLSTFETVEFSHISHPDMQLLTAVHASAALPILFKPAEYAGELYTDGGFMLNYPLAKCRADPATILGVRNAYLENTTNINDVKGIFEYLSYILNMMVDKSQCETTVKPRYEILLKTGFIDYTTIWSLAKNPAEREALIKKVRMTYKENLLFLYLDKFIQIFLCNLGIKFVNVAIFHHFNSGVIFDSKLVNHLHSLRFIYISAVNWHTSDFETINRFTIIFVSKL